MVARAILLLSFFILVIAAVKAYDGSTFDPAVASQQKTRVMGKVTH